MNTIKKIISQFNLTPHPEGGYYARVYESAISVNLTDNRIRPAGTAIYYFLHDNDFSAWHKIKSDELWHYYKGSPFIIYEIDLAGELHTHICGDPWQHPDAHFQIMIHAEHWFAAELMNKNHYGLAGCTVSPGFDFRDFELAERSVLSALFPQHTSIIRKLTRT